MTDPSNPEFRISIDDPDLQLGQDNNNISLVLTGSQGTQATINLPVQVQGKPNDKKFFLKNSPPRFSWVGVFVWLMNCVRIFLVHSEHLCKLWWKVCGGRGGPGSDV